MSPSLAALRSLAVRLLARSLPNAAKKHGLRVDLGPGIPGWLRVSLTGFMGKTLPGVVGYPVEAIAISRFGGFHQDARFSDFQNPDSACYQCWYGAYLVWDNARRQRFGFAPDGGPSFQDALDALEADQRLVFHSAGIPNTFPDGRLVHRVGDVTQEQVEEAGRRWWRLRGEAETWSAYHRGRLPGERWQFGWCYGSVPAGLDHGVHDLHPLTYRGEFWVRYEPAWQVTCAKFWIYPHYTEPSGREVDKGTPELIAAGQRALAGVRFYGPSTP
jgi:hypothetical protein